MNRSRIPAVFATTLAIALTALVISPVTPARASSPALTISSVVGVPDQYFRHYGQIRVTGTVTCSQPSGQALVSVLVTQALPIVVQSGSSTVDCAVGPVAWTVLVGSSFVPGGFPPPFHPGIANVLVSSAVDGVTETGTSGSYPV